MFPVQWQFRLLKTHFSLVNFSFVIGWRRFPTFMPALNEIGFGQVKDFVVCLETSFISDLDLLSELCSASVQVLHLVDFSFFLLRFLFLCISIFKTIFVFLSILLSLGVLAILVFIFRLFFFTDSWSTVWKFEHLKNISLSFLQKILPRFDQNLHRQIPLPRCLRIVFCCCLVFLS